MCLYCAVGFGEDLNLQTLLVLFSSLSFLAYGVSYFVTPYMKTEFQRFGMSKYAGLTIFLEFAGAIGLLVGLWSRPLLILSAGGLALLMFCGLVVRVRIGDSLKLSFPALFYLVLNVVILVGSFLRVSPHIHP